MSVTNLDKERALCVLDGLLVKLVRNVGRGHFFNASHRHIAALGVVFSPGHGNRVQIVNQCGDSRGMGQHDPWYHGDDRQFAVTESMIYHISV